MPTDTYRPSNRFEPIPHDTLVPVDGYDPSDVGPGDILFTSGGPVRIARTRKAGSVVTLFDVDGYEHGPYDVRAGDRVTVDGPTVLTAIAGAIDESVRERDDYGMPYAAAEHLAIEMRRFDSDAASNLRAWVHGEYHPDGAAHHARRLARAARDAALEAQT